MNWLSRLTQICLQKWKTLPRIGDPPFTGPVVPPFSTGPFLLLTHFREMYRIRPAHIPQKDEPMTFTKVCPACGGNGYVPDSDGEQTGYRDCEVCDSQGTVPEEDLEHPDGI